MRVLRTLSISDAVLAALDSDPVLSIIGVYDRSVALQCGDEVWSIVESDTGNLPRGLLMDQCGGSDWKTTNLMPGMSVRRDGRYLLLLPDLALDLVAARTWQARRYLPASPTALEAVLIAARRAAQFPSQSMGGLGAASTHLERILFGEAPTLSGGPAFAAHALALLCGISRAIQIGDRAALVDSATGLVGLGIGLTPSGDDVLTGVIGSLVLMADWAPGLGWARGAAETLLARAQGRTNSLSMTFLRCAALGEITEAHERLLSAVLAGDSDRSLAARTNLAAFGHSSGGEIALGTLLAVRSASPWLWPSAKYPDRSATLAGNAPSYSAPRY